MSKLRDEIIKGHSRGWSYTPLGGADGKKPILEDWPTLPRESIDQALRWAEAGNVGLRTGAISGIFGVDWDSLTLPPESILPITWTVLTGRNRFHLLYAYFGPWGNKTIPALKKHLNAEAGEHHEIRGDGGQLVAVGSINPETGGEYRWMPGRSPDEIPIVQFPIALLPRDWKAEQALRLQREGKTVRDIADAVGCGTGRVKELLDLAVLQEQNGSAPGAQNGRAGARRTCAPGAHGLQGLTDENRSAPGALNGSAGRSGETKELTSDFGSAPGARSGRAPERQLPPHPNSQKPNKTDISPYLRAALDNEVTNVANAPGGTRNQTLNQAAFNLGMLVSGAGLDRSTVETALIAGAEACGLHTDSNCGPDGIRKTIKSGLDAGILKPRHVDPPKRQTAPPTPARREAAPPTVAGALPPHPGVGAGDPPPPDGFVALGGRDPDSNKLVLSPKRTLPTAEAWQREFYDHPESRRIHTYAEILLAWDGSRFAEIEERAAKSRLQPWLHDALRYAINKKTGNPELVPFESNPGTVNAALESIRSHTHLPSIITPPAWLKDEPGLPSPKDLLPYRSAILHVPTGRLLPQTPALFNINALDFDYDPAAEPPEMWIKFLEQLWQDDIESVQLLQEWMGYCLVGDTSQQKMLLMVGPKRSGKGTIGRILSRLVGSGNVVGPTTSSLAGPFGLQPLIGKSLAIVSDARFSGESVAIVTERLLCITGEDALTIDRKFMGAVTMKLSTRFMFLTNELPRMRDASGALPGRFLILKLDQTFYGKEDVTLTEKLMSELPGILLWAIEGLKRLRQRGYFVMPKSSQEALEEMEELASPALAFIRECCDMGAGKRVWQDDLYAVWESWCRAAGRTIQTTKAMFGKDLLAACPSIAKRRAAAAGWAFYEGMALKEGLQPQPPLMGGLR